MVADQRPPLVSVFLSHHHHRCRDWWRLMHDASRDAVMLLFFSCVGASDPSVVHICNFARCRYVPLTSDLAFFHGLFLKKYWIVLEKSWQRHLSGKLHLSLASNFFLFRLILPQHLAESMNTFHSCLSMLFQRLSRSTIKWSLWSLSAKKGLSRHVLVYDPSGVVFSTWSHGVSAIRWSQWTAFHHKSVLKSFFALVPNFGHCDAKWYLVNIRQNAKELFYPADHRNVKRFDPMILERSKSEDKKHLQQFSSLECDDWVLFICVVGAPLKFPMI